MTKENNNLSELPEDWVWTRLGSIGKVSSGGTPSTRDQTNFNGDIPWITPADLSGYNGKFISRGCRNLSIHGLSSSSAKLLPKGTVVYSSRAPIGYVAIAKNSISTNQGFKNLMVGKHIFNEYVYFYLKGNKSLADSFASGTTFRELSANRFSQIPIPLPPLAEQRRIVAKVEEVFTRLDAGIEALKRAKKELKRYQQAVLKSAFEGKLTAEWREAHKDELEKASVLLIKTLRKKEKESKKKQNSFSPLEDFDLEILPDTWLWLTLDYLSTGNKNSIKRGPFGSTIKKEFFVNNGYKVYQQKNVIYNDFDWGDYFIDEKKFEELKSFEVKSKDILISCSGTIGKIAIVPEGIRPGIINQALLKIALDNSVVATRYFVYLFRSKISKIISGNTRGSAMVNISSVRDLKQIPFPIPPLSEQHKIVEEIESRFSVADEVERTVEQSLKQAGRLRQSILKKAFEGKLVAQNSSDEPAEKLLERIKAEKAKRETEKKRKKRSKTRINLKQRELL